MGEKKIQNFAPKKFKNSIFWAQKWSKMTKKSKKNENFFVGIDLEWSKTCFKPKISILKIFPVEIFFLGHSRFSKKMRLMGQMTIERVERVTLSSPGAPLIQMRNSGKPSS